jgi:hypothetical protein
MSIRMLYTGEYSVNDGKYRPTSNRYSVVAPNIQ